MKKMAHFEGLPFEVTDCGLLLVVRTPSVIQGIL